LKIKGKTQLAPKCAKRRVDKMVSECNQNKAGQLDFPVYNDIITSLVSEHTIDREAMRAFYTQSVDIHQIERACHVFNVLESRFANDREIKSLNIALSLQCSDYDGAMQRIQWLIATCKPDDGILDAALAVREKIKPCSSRKDGTAKASISLCMITKDEISRLGACLHAAKHLVDEIIVVDTGSKDRTRDVARIFGAKVFEYQWGNDFSAARNFSLERATGDWILILDADEILARRDLHTIRDMIDKLDGSAAAFAIETRNYTSLINGVDWHANTGDYSEYEAGFGWFPTRKVRLFPRSSDIRFVFPVHERVDPSLRNAGIRIVDCPIPVHHYGNLNQEKKRLKARDYFQLGYAKLDCMQHDLEAIRELAVQAGELEYWQECVDLWNQVLTQRPDFVEAHVNVSSAYWQQGRYDKALDAARNAVRLDPQSREAAHNLAISLMMLGRDAEAIEILQPLVGKHAEYLPSRFLLAICLACRNDNHGSIKILNDIMNTEFGRVLPEALEDISKRIRMAGLDMYDCSLRKLYEQLKRSRLLGFKTTD
jgi:O-antigen biosynthesis protein